jgi:hypothetical protein
MIDINVVSLVTVNQTGVIQIGTADQQTMLVVVYHRRPWEIETNLKDLTIMDHHHGLVMLVAVVVQIMMILHHVLVVVVTGISVPTIDATNRVPVRCMATIDRRIAVVMFLITIIHMIRNYLHLQYHPPATGKEMVLPAIIIMVLQIEISVIDSKLQHHIHDVTWGQGHIRMVVMVRDVVVVIMVLVIADHPMMIIPDEIGMAHGESTAAHHLIHLPDKRLAVTARFMVTINFIVVMVVEEEEDDNPTVVTHVIQEIAIGEKIGLQLKVGGMNLKTSTYKPKEETLLRILIVGCR